MKRLISIKEITQKKFEEIDLGCEFTEMIGKPTLSGTWMIFGKSKNGKTSFSLQLASRLTFFEKVLYLNVEERNSKAFQDGIVRNCQNIIESNIKFYTEIVTINELISFLKRKKSPKIIFIDSLQFYGLLWSEYKELKKIFKNKLFIYVSHERQGMPDSSCAVKIMRDSDVIVRVEDFMGYPVSRYGGGETYVISKDKVIFNRLADDHKILEDE
jgi:hypothetical protein